MPIEIKELVIKTTVTDNQDSRNEEVTANVDVDALVSRCVNQVVQLLNRKKDR